MRIRLIFLIFIFFCGASSAASAAPQKIVSLDICADYYLALFAGHSVMMFTRQAKDGFSLPMNIRKDNHTHNNNIEEIVRFNPDMVLKTSLTHENLSEKVQKYPYQTINLPWATDLSGLKTIHNLMNEVTPSRKAEKLNAKINKFLSQIPKKTDKNMLILGLNGFTVKRGTHYDMLFDILGINNYHQDNGYGTISLEEIAAAPPDYIITIGKDAKRPQLSTSNLEHNVLKKLNIPTFDISDQFTICPSVELISTAEKLKEMMK